MDIRDIRQISTQDVLDWAKQLKSEGGTNPEYDRALVELTGHTLGCMTEELDEIAHALGIQWPVPASTTLLAYKDDAEPIAWEQEDGCICDAGRAEAVMGDKVAHTLMCVLRDQ